jgi:phosphoribosylanthranilate isomerase
VRVKVCGIRIPEEVDLCVDAGVHALGFICGVTHRAEDAVDPETVRRLSARVPPFVITVLVTHLTDLPDLKDLISETWTHAVQLQGDVSVDGILHLKRRFPGRKWIKAVHVNEDGALSRAMEYAPYVDALLLDTRTSDRLGGTGITHDWKLSAVIRDSVSCPVILAGGLRPENVEEAVRIVRPYAVDANSGLEDKDGFKDRDRVREFVRNATKDSCLRSRPH